MEVGKYIPTSSAVAVKSELTINDLDDDSLGIIFNNLPCIDRIRIESVCERWREVSEANWCFYSKRLIIDDNMGGFSRQKINSNQKSANLLEESLRRRGPIIEEIDFKVHSSSIFKTGTIERIAGLCPKLKRLHLGTIDLNHKDWLAIDSNIEVLSFGFFADVSGDELRELLRRTKRLRELNIDSHYCLEPRAFDYLDPGQLEFLKVTDCKQFILTNGLADKLAESLVDLFYRPSRNDTCYLYNLYKLKNLRSLNLKVPCKQFEDTLIADIAENCRKLECLILDLPQGYPCNETIVAPLFGLPCLRRLEVSVIKMEAISRERLRMLFQKASKLKLFIMNTCVQNIYLSKKKLLGRTYIF